MGQRNKRNPLKTSAAFAALVVPSPVGARPGSRRPRSNNYKQTSNVSQNAPTLTSQGRMDPGSFRE